MSLHLYAIGNSVIFSGAGEYLRRAKGQYEISRLLPEDDATGELQYRLKSKLEGYERRAKESELELCPAVSLADSFFRPGALGEAESGARETARLGLETGMAIRAAAAPTLLLRAD